MGSGIAQVNILILDLNLNCIIIIRLKDRIPPI